MPAVLMNRGYCYAEPTCSPHKWPQPLPEFIAPTHGGMAKQQTVFKVHIISINQYGTVTWNMNATNSASKYRAIISSSCWY